MLEIGFCAISPLERQTTKSAKNRSMMSRESKSEAGVLTAAADFTSATGLILVPGSSNWMPYTKGQRITYLTTKNFAEVKIVTHLAIGQVGIEIDPSQ
jgi:hypothetical protein